MADHKISTTAMSYCLFLFQRLAFQFAIILLLATNVFLAGTLLATVIAEFSLLLAVAWFSFFAYNQGFLAVVCFATFGFANLVQVGSTIVASCLIFTITYGFR